MEQVKSSNTHNNNEKAVNLIWTWYLFLFGNVLMVIGVAITWGICGKGVSTNTAYISTIVCNIVAIIIIGLFYFFDAKEIYLVKQHVPHKYIRLYFVPGFIFITNLIFVFTYIALIDKIKSAFDSTIEINAAFGILFGITALISLITIGIYRYARYKIDLSIHLRRRGQMLEDNKLVDIDKPTSGISNNADQK